MRGKQFLAVIAIIFLFAIVLVFSGTLFNRTENSSTEIVKELCNFVRNGNSEALKKIIADTPTGFDERVHIAYGGKLTTIDNSPNSARPSKRSNLTREDLVSSILRNSFELSEQVNIKEVLEVKEFQDEAKVKVLLSESDLHRERVCTFLLTKESGEWKIFYIDNETLPESLRFAEEKSTEKKL